MHHVFLNPESSSTPRPVLGRSIAAALRSQQRNLAYSLLESVGLLPNWQTVWQANHHDLENFLKIQFFAFVDYLALFFETGDTCYRDLYIGERLKQMYDPNLDVAENLANRPTVLAADEKIFLTFADSLPNQEARGLLLETMALIHRVIQGETSCSKRILFVGDCLHLDVNSFLPAALQSANISIIPAFATSKNPVELRETIRRLSSTSFDLVFFSPFSYAFNLDYAQTLEWSIALKPREAITQLTTRALQQVKTTADLLADLFDCPIYIHNSAAALLLEEVPLKQQIKRWVTYRARQIAKQQVNAWLQQYIQEVNSRTYKHLFLLDENQLLQGYGEAKLGQYLYHSPIQHPARLGQAVARLYWDAIFIHTHLATKKLVVCDLDNTLWDGVIGEGAVRHFPDRQAILQQLKQRGVVLAINSKNDPAKVHWEGGTLTGEDFVYASISWDPKVAGMKRIQQALNLKMKDYVFIDDRSDERELMAMTYPDVCCLDAANPRTWELFQGWVNVLEDQPDMDRTQMYREREQRKEFVKTEEGAGEGADPSLFEALNLRLAIRDASPADLQRVAELINRTNQFNIQGSRTTYREVKDWHQSGEYRIFLGEASDRFGDMGTVCILVIRQTETALTIPVFVLSCRVFGYGIEKAMLNHVKQIAVAHSTPLQGRYMPTGRNQPCEHVFRDNGFVFDGEAWSWQGEQLEENPRWLQVTASAR